MKWARFLIFAVLVAIAATGHGNDSLAYIGPGAGFAFLGSFLTLLSGVLMSVGSLLLWPFRMAWKVGVSWERYESSGSLSLREVDVENPGLVSFNVLMFNLSARF